METKSWSKKARAINVKSSFSNPYLLMTNDRLLGGAIFGGSIIGIIVYAILLYLPSTSLLTLQVTAFLAVTVLLGILSWIGWTMATTPAPEPITEISPSVTTPSSTESQSTDKSMQSKENEVK
jgi:predicted DNA-binding transcriptional regulator